MALIVENEKIVGTIDNLQDKLDGKIPVDRLELIYLVNSWGRTDFFYTQYLDEDIRIEKCEEKECYDLSKLDVSEITNMRNIFCFSNFNGNISNWDVSNVTSMYGMFGRAKKFNSDISNWDVSNVENMDFMFAETKVFNQNINSWNLDKIEYCEYMFYKAESFLNKYNNGKDLPYNTEKIKDWFNLNRDKMNEIDIKENHGDEINNFFSNIDLKKYNEINKE